MIARLLPLLVLVLLSLPGRADNWPAWRGPQGTGVSAEKELPVRWSATENVRWKVRPPGAGVSTPAVWGERVLLTSSDGRFNDTLHLFCYHRDDGRLLWHARFFGSAQPEGQFPPGGMAVPSPVTDGRYAWALFGTGDLVCVDLDGRPVWVRSLAQEYGPFRNRWGMAASPLLVDGLLVVQVDHFGKSYLLGIDARTGADRWKAGRDATVNWTSPAAVRVGDRLEVVAVGTHTIKGYDAATGKELWTLAGMQNQCIPSPLSCGDLLFAAAGHDQHTLALRLPHTGERQPAVAWKVRTRGGNIPSPLCLDGHYYYAEDSTWGDCLDARTGERVWRRRLGRTFRASPVAGAGKVYFADATGVVSVVRAGSTFELLARNDIGEPIVASPALSQGRIFLRGDQHLFCIGTPR